MALDIGYSAGFFGSQSTPLLPPFAILALKADKARRETQRRTEPPTAKPSQGRFYKRLKL